MAGLVSVRDAASRDELIACGLPEDRIHLGADLAFLSETDRPSAQGVAALGAPRPVLAVALRPWTFAGDPARWEAAIAAALGQWCAAHGGHVVFVPLHDSSQPLEDDRLVAERVAAQVGLPDRVRQVPVGHRPPNDCAILGSADVVLGMRYHALLAALAAGVPCVGLAYDPKVRHLMDEAGCGDAVLKLEELDAGDSGDAADEAMDRPSDRGRIECCGRVRRPGSSARSSWRRCPRRRARRAARRSSSSANPPTWPPSRLPCAGGSTCRPPTDRGPKAAWPPSTLPPGDWTRPSASWRQVRGELEEARRTQSERAELNEALAEKDTVTEPPADCES